MSVASYRVNTMLVILRCASGKKNAKSTRVKLRSGLTTTVHQTL